MNASLQNHWKTLNASIETSFTNHIRKVQDNTVFECFSWNEDKRRCENRMGMSVKNRLTIVAMWTVGLIILILIFWDPLNILDSTQEIILAVIVMVANTPLLLYQRQRILKKMKKTT
jgi:hypothetical protein